MADMRLSELEVNQFVVPAGYKLVFWTSRDLSIQQMENLKSWWKAAGLDAVIVTGVDGACAVPKALAGGSL